MLWLVYDSEFELGITFDENHSSKKCSLFRIQWIDNEPDNNNDQLSEACLKNA